MTRERGDNAAAYAGRDAGGGAALRRPARARRHGARELELADGPRVARRLGRARARRRAAGPALRGQPGLRATGDARSPTGDEVALIPPVSGGALPPHRPSRSRSTTRRARGRATTARARSPRSSARRASTRAAAPSTTSSTRRTRAWPSEVHGASSRPSCASGTSLPGRDPPPRRPGRDRRAEVVIAVSAPAPRGGARRLPRGDRHAQGDRAALEEGGLRGRRGVDRPGFVSDARRLPSAACERADRPPRLVREPRRRRRG